MSIRAKVVVAIALKQIDNAPHAKASAITSTFKVSIALVKNAINYLHKFVVIG